MKTLTQEQVTAILAFIESHELYVSGVWPTLEQHMRDDYGIENPEEALEAAVDALR